MSKIIKGYISGSFFDTLLAQSRIDLANKIRSLANNDVQIDLYNPIETTINTTDRYNVNEKELYKNNNQYIDNADFIVLDLTDHNSGTLVEFGRISTVIEKVNPNLKLYVLWRLHLNGEQYHFAVNRYVRGAVEKYSRYYRNEQEIIDQIKKDFDL